LDLAEMQIVFDQMHARMNMVSQLMSFSVALVAAVIGAAAASDQLRQSDWAFLLFALPFLLFASLILREDYLMVAHDRYWYELRHRLHVATHSSADALSFLPFIKRWKFGNWFTIASGLRYGASIVAAAACVIWALFNFSEHQLVFKLFVLAVDITLGAAFGIALYRLIGLHQTNEVYRQDLEASLAQEIITVEPDKRGGDPCIRGLRITVYDVLSYLASGMTEEEIISDYPDLTHEDILASLSYAADRERKTAISHAV
jgi:uncharacterized protein (DUF433 family)